MPTSKVFVWLYVLCELHCTHYVRSVHRFTSRPHHKIPCSKLSIRNASTLLHSDTPSVYTTLLSVYLVRHLKYSVPFIMSLSKAALMHWKPASARASRDRDTIKGRYFSTDERLNSKLAAGSSRTSVN
jgi:hypothetical protein